MSDQLTQRIRDLMTTGYAPSRQQAEEEHNTQQTPEWATPWALTSRLRALAADDPRRRLLVYRQVNDEELTDADQRFIFGPDPRMATPQEGQAK